MAAAFPSTDRTLVMGVLNVTADSFSDGGRYLHHDRAIEHGLRMHAEGADIVDVGGESTRPGAHRVDNATERQRVVPVIDALSSAGVVTTVDTMRSDIAEAAIEAGCGGINDVSGGLADPRMLEVAAALDVPLVLMHWRDHSAQMQQQAVYADVVREVIDELQQRIDAAVAAGVRREQIVIDPGLGFAKTAAHNWSLLHAMDQFVGLGLPVLLGASRKSFLGALLAEDGQSRPAYGREDATTAISALAAVSGLWGVRTHNVRASRDAVEVARAWRQGRA